MFYNTGIATYIWVLTNRKPAHRRGKVQLIDATQWFKPLRKNLGKKNCELSEDDIARICDTFLAFEETEQSKIFPNAAFGYWKVTVERPLRAARHRPETGAYTPKEIKAMKAEGTRRSEAGACRSSARISQDGQGRGRSDATGTIRGRSVMGGKACVVEYEPDSDLRDTEQVPLLEAGGIEAFIRREVLPHAPDAWMTNRPDRRSATRSASPATSTSLSHCALWRRSAPTSWPGAGDRGIAGADRRRR